MEEQEKDENNKSVKPPVLTEEDLIDIVKNLRNGKAAGIDGMKAEMIKYLFNNPEIRRHAIKCFNKVLYEEVHEDW